MYPSAKNQPARQCASEAMAVWERAATDNKPVGIDQHGNVTVLFGASIDSFRGPASQRQTAKDAILVKMQSEMAQRGSWNGMAIYHVMASELPSLNSFVRNDQVVDLRSEWDFLIHNAEASLDLPPEVLQQRMDRAERIAPYLPPGAGISLHDDGLSWFKHVFTAGQQQEIIQRLISLANDPLDPTLNIDKQMLKDLNRDSYEIILPKGPPRFEEITDNNPLMEGIKNHPELTPKAKATLHQLLTFCDDNLAMLATLSRLMNQKSVLALMKSQQIELSSPSGTDIKIHAQSKKENTKTVYRLYRNEHANVCLSVSHMKKGSELRGGDLMSTLCRLKPGPRSEIADESHFNFRCHAEISMAAKYLKLEKIIPSYIYPTSVDYVLDVDWKSSL